MFYIPYEIYQLSMEERNLKNIIKRIIIENLVKDQKYFIKIDKIRKNFCFIIIDIKEYDLYVSIKKLFENYTELLPPWTVFPDMMQGYPRWNQGVQADYCSKHWIPYWGKMTEDEQVKYCMKHNAPEEWVEYLKENSTYLSMNYKNYEGNIIIK
ncbi:hypothetical protein FACS1894110_22130 [Spirochaetia bacterium]|nr:hypothetical protein FACS1894110_22130 [Spirochaetia bacterium]